MLVSCNKTLIQYRYGSSVTNLGVLLECPDMDYSSSLLADALILDRIIGSGKVRYEVSQAMNIVKNTNKCPDSLHAVTSTLIACVANESDIMKLHQILLTMFFQDICTPSWILSAG